MSHTFTNLASKVFPSDANKICAEKIPLMHTVRSADGINRLIDIFKSGRLGGVDICQRVSTNSAQQELGIPANSAYFYAGRVFPDDFDPPACFLITGELESEADSGIGGKPPFVGGGAVPFDSGGLATDKLRLWEFQKTLAQTDKLNYFKDHSVTLEKWREYFSLFVEEFFSNPEGYWGSNPAKAIDNVTFEPEDDWRNWSFEIHSSAPVGFENAEVVFVGENVLNTLQDELVNMPQLASLMGKFQVCTFLQVDALNEAKRLSCNL
ncbi:MAG: hypothetical protein HZB23_03465 [Deltaproteobacteria bacterium]|nr:hypothetical protein [Deltaproteobacteria bacterium]